MKKGISEIVVAIILMVVGVSVAVSFYYFSQTQLTRVGEAAAEQLDTEELRSRSSLYIENVSNGNEVFVRNSGQTDLPVGSFVAFSNVSNSTSRNLLLPQILTISCKGTSTLVPGNTTKFRVCAPVARSGWAFIKVSGAYSTFDEINATVSLPFCPVAC